MASAKLGEPLAGASLQTVWIYTCAIAFGFGGLVAILTGDIRVMLPVIGLSVLVGLAGTVINYRKPVKNADTAPDYTKSFAE